MPAVAQSVLHDSPAGMSSKEAAHRHTPPTQLSRQTTSNAGCAERAPHAEMGADVEVTPSLGDTVGAEVGAAAGATEGAVEGSSVLGPAVGAALSVGLPVGCEVGLVGVTVTVVATDGDPVGVPDGASVGATGASVGLDGATVVTVGSAHTQTSSLSPTAPHGSAKAAAAKWLQRVPGASLCLAVQVSPTAAHMDVHDSPGGIVSTAAQAHTPVATHPSSQTSSIGLGLALANAVQIDVAVGATVGAAVGVVGAAVVGDRVGAWLEGAAVGANDVGAMDVGRLEVGSAVVGLSDVGASEVGLSDGAEVAGAEDDGERVGAPVGPIVPRQIRGNSSAPDVVWSVPGWAWQVRPPLQSLSTKHPRHSYPMSWSDMQVNVARKVGECSRPVISSRKNGRPPTVRASGGLEVKKGSSQWPNAVPCPPSCSTGMLGLCGLPQLAALVPVTWQWTRKKKS